MSFIHPNPQNQVLMVSSLINSTVVDLTFRGVNIQYMTGGETKTIS